MESKTLSRILQRLPIFTHVLVFALATLGQSLCPRLLVAFFIFINITFIASQTRMAYGMIRCYLGVKAHWRTDWWSFYLRGLQKAPLSALETRYSPLTLPHIIIIPSYKESLSTLRHTLNILASHPLAVNTYTICLAMEQREQGSWEKGLLLANEFRTRFFDIVQSLHPGDIPDELPGKGSNTRWAARWMAERVAMRGTLSTVSTKSPPSGKASENDAIVTIMDADTAFAADYFIAAATRYLLATPETRRNIMFVPPIIFDRNQADVPVFTRCTDIMWATAGISGIYPSSTIKIPTSAYSISLQLATHVGFWDAGPQAIGEDMHMFCKALFDTKGHLHVETIYSPASQCNVVGSKSSIGFGSGSGFFTSFLDDCHARWTQAVRHMWGSLDTGYVVQRLITRDFGVSYQRELEHRLHRIEMRQIIANADIQRDDNHSSRVEVTGSVQHGKPVPRWLDTRTTSEEDTVSELSSATMPSSADSITGIGGSSDYSYSSSDEDATMLRGIHPAFQASDRDSELYATHHHPNITPSTRKFPFLVLAFRMYEAHLMLAHLFILINVLVVAPKLGFQLEKQLAKQTEVWGRGASSMAIRSIVHQEETLLSTSITWCNRLGAMGVLASVITFLFHDLYHREAGNRWKPVVRNSIQLRSSGVMESGISSTHPLGHVNLGIPPSPHSTRSLPWCFFDYLAVPGGLVFGVAPLLYAQVCHLWTDRLAYKVSAKPQAGK